MKTLVIVAIYALAVTGALALSQFVSNTLHKHYATVCVDDNADDYGFTIPRIKTGRRHTAEL